MSKLLHTLDCAACGTKVTMPGVVWETTGTALPSTASLCFLWVPCSLWFLRSRERMAEALSSRACRTASRPALPDPLGAVELLLMTDDVTETN